MVQALVAAHMCAWVAGRQGRTRSIGGNRAWRPTSNELSTSTPVSIRRMNSCWGFSGRLVTVDSRDKGPGVATNVAVIIAGGGPVGLMLAGVLGKLGVRTLLV